MAINFPTSLDNFTNPLGTQTLDSPDHAGQHSDANDALEALEAKIGLGAGTPTANKLLVGSGNGTATWTTTWNGGTINNATIGTSQFTGGTVNNVVIGTSAITGGTITTPLISGTATFDTAIAGSAVATGAEITTGTDNTQIVTPKGLGDAGVNTRLKSKTGTFTRDAAGTTANVAYTGVGFVPTSIVFTAVISGAVHQSVGFADSAKGGKVITRAFDGNNYANLYTDACIAIAQATGSNDQWAKVASYDSDGFTLTWTKVNSPTGSITIDYIAYR